MSLLGSFPLLKETSENSTQTESEPIKQFSEGECQTSILLSISIKTQTDKVDCKTGGTQTIDAKT